MNVKAGLRRGASLAPASAVLVLVLCLAPGAPASAQAVNGAISYAPASPPILLLGEWERYDGYQTEETLGSTAQVPALAELQVRAGLRDIPHIPAGAYTYRILVTVRGSPAEREYAFALPGIGGYRAVIVNGRKLYDSAAGSPQPSLYYFRDATSRISILVQCAPGGRLLERAALLPAKPVFGELSAVAGQGTYDFAGVFSLIGFFLVQAVFVLALFVFWRKNLDFLSFSIFLAASAILSYFKYGAILHGLPGLRDVEGMEAGYVMAIDVQNLGLSLFLVSLFHRLLHRMVAVAVLIPPALLACAAVALPAFQRDLYAISVFYMGSFLLCALVFIAAQAFRGNHQARWIVPAFVPAAGAIVYRIALPDSLPGAFLIEPLGQVFLAFMAMLMLVKKVAGSFESVETLSDYVSSVSRTMSSFIPKEFLEYLDKSDVTDLRLGDHIRKKMTIFFSDIRAFTALSERLTVEENFAFINSYLSRVVPIIRENGGFVDKYIGDAIMALYSGNAGADQAIRSAIAMQAKIVEYNGHRAKMGYAPISMGVGIHTGDLMLGVVGVHDRMENTVISDSVNLSSRLQAITKAFNISLAISEQSFKELEDPGSYKYRFIGKVKVKGKAAPVSVFEIFDGIEPELFERKMKANTFFEQGMLS
ncbi:MAG TPA: adenylate/guanylate cyclase domain-containing protein, partial [Rectinemataceae bacterium]|nr:adenylate/guanylate cyclase domain-containing protein [Rectinemataceae bacterium]